MDTFDYTLIDEYTPPFNVETYQCGYWESVEVTQTLEDALWLASAICFHYMDLENYPYREEEVRVIDFYNRII